MNCQICESTGEPRPEWLEVGILVRPQVNMILNKVPVRLADLYGGGNPNSVHDYYNVEQREFSDEEIAMVTNIGPGDVEIMFDGKLRYVIDNEIEGWEPVSHDYCC